MFISLYVAIPLVLMFVLGWLLCFINRYKYIKLRDMPDNTSNSKHKSDGHPSCGVCLDKCICDTIPC